MCDLSKRKPFNPYRMPSIYLTHWEFDLIFCQLYEKWKKATKKNFSKKEDWRRVIGYPASQEIKGYKTLCDLINEDLNIKDVLKKGVGPGYFYPRLHKIYEGENPDAEMELEERYQKLFFGYLGFDHYDTFVKARYQTHQYTGKYYSATKQKICSFDLSLIIPPQVEEAAFPHRAWVHSHGFHDNIPKTILKGPIEHYNESWLAFLKSGLHYLQLSIYTRSIIPDIDQVAAFNQLFGAISTISKSGHLIHVECVLAKKRTGNAAKLGIDRYLQLRRHYFGSYITEEDQGTMEGVKTGDISIGEIERLAGRSFRILAQSPNGELIQSKFRIKKDYSASIRVPKVEKQRELRCSIFVDNISKGSLLVYSYLRDIKKIYTVTAIKYVSNNKKKGLIMQGAYIMVADRYGEPVSFNFVLIEDASKFEIKTYTHAEAEKWQDGDIRKKLLTALLKRGPSSTP